jgi:hypothetical protein
MRRCQVTRVSPREIDQEQRALLLSGLAWSRYGHCKNLYQKLAGGGACDRLSRCDAGIRYLCRRRKTPCGPPRDLDRLVNSERALAVR